MDARTIIPVGVCLLTLALSCLAGTPTASTAPPAVQAVVQGGNAFGLELYALLAGKEKGNLFLSPSSIHTALAMTYAGARGRTAGQMAATLHFTLPAKELNAAFGALLKTFNAPRTVTVMAEGPGGRLVRKQVPAYQLSVANALWAARAYPFRKEFVETVKADYGAKLAELDFAQSAAARKTINDWVAQQTNDKITDLIPPGAITALTRLVLTNAIYFKSNWAEKFEKSATADGDWHLAGGAKATVPLMHQQDRFGYMETDDFQALRMPYKAGDLDMFIFLPRKADGLAAFEKTLSSANLDKWLGQFRPEEVKVTLPRFKFDSQFRLNDALAALGMADAFNADAADFSGMTTTEKLCISAVIHKAFVAVDEEGTEAAAATAVMMLGAAMPVAPPRPKVFTADHPFVFAIRHAGTGDVLFLGRLADPR